MTKAIKARLLKNARITLDSDGEDCDHKPALKIFDPCGPAVWLLTEMDPDAEDRLFGLGDLGMGYPELGWVCLSELESVTGPLGLHMERDLYFSGEYPMSVYTDTARTHSRIVSNEMHLLRATAVEKGIDSVRDQGASVDDSLPNGPDA